MSDFHVSVRSSFIQRLPRLMFLPTTLLNNRTAQIIGLLCWAIGCCLRKRLPTANKSPVNVNDQYLAAFFEFFKLIA